MELFRSLGVLLEPPSSGAARSASALGLGALPSAAEHADLLEFQLYPYASVYLGSEGMLGGEARDRIAGFWRALGETPPPEPDHLTILLAAYAELGERELDAADDGTRLRWRHARTAFLWEHLLSWLPVYLEKLANLGSEFYSKWSGLLWRALLEEATAFDPGEGRPLSDALPLHLREAPSLGELDEAGGDDFLRAITTPVRTGLILVRADFEACARDLGLGLRKGERRFALKSLLGQSPKVTLGWLADEAERQAARHGARHEAIAMISAFWERRAVGTAALLRSASAHLQE